MDTGTKIVLLAALLVAVSGFFQGVANAAGCGSICGNNQTCCTGYACCNWNATASFCDPKPSTTVCRSAAGTCDAVEYCDGSLTNCPADSKLSGKQSCSTCLYCTGSSNDCSAVSGNTDPYNECSGTYSCANSYQIRNASVCSGSPSGGCGYDFRTCGLGGVGGLDTCSDTGGNTGGGSCSSKKYYCSTGSPDCANINSSVNDQCSGTSTVQIGYYSCIDDNLNSINDTCSFSTYNWNDSCSDYGDTYGGGSCTAADYYCSGNTRSLNNSAGFDTCPVPNGNTITYYYCSGGNRCLSANTTVADSCSDTGNANGGGSCSASDWYCKEQGSIDDLLDSSSSGTDVCGGTADSPSITTYYSCNATGNACVNSGAGSSASDSCSKPSTSCSATNYFCSGTFLNSTSSSGSDSCGGVGSPYSCQKTIYSCTAGDGSATDTCTGTTSNISSGYVCTGSGTQTTGSSTYYCGLSSYNACSGDLCDKTRDYLACSGLNTCAVDVGDDTAAVASGYYCSGGSEVSGACDSSASCSGETYYTGHTCNGGGACSTLDGSTDKDSSSTACVSTASGCTARSWNIGGEVAATTCCGDDSGESVRTRSCSGVCVSDGSDNACCGLSNDCVYNSVCTDSGSSGGSVGGNGTTDYCLSGTWYDCGSNSDCAAGQECNTGTFACQPSVRTMIGNAVSWVWNTTGPSSVIRSGSPTNWVWRTIQSGSGRQIPNGTATSWNWRNE